MAEDGWVHCGNVDGNFFNNGCTISVHYETLEIRKVFTKIQSDGKRLQKVELYTKDGCKCGFFINEEHVCDINQRIDSFFTAEDTDDWLSLKI